MNRATANTTLTIKRLSTFFIAAVLLGAVAVFNPIQPAYAGNPSFLILDNGTGGDCEGEDIGKWNDKTKTCRLTADIENDGITIGDDDITLNCNGHLLDGPGSDVGIRLNDKEGVTIRNCHVTNFNNGIFLFASNDNTLQGNTANGNFRNGIFLDDSDGNTLNGNTATGNNFDGIFLDDSDGNTLNENTTNGNNFGGIFLFNSDFNTLNDNTANENNIDGILVEFSNNNTLNENTTNGNDDEGIRLNNSSNDNTLNDLFK